MKANKKVKKYKTLWIKTRDLITSITKNSDDYDEKYMMSSSSSDDVLPLNKAIEIPSLKIVVTATFLEITNIIHKIS